MSAKSYRNSGFTIVELLIVIVVIGILAAITVVAYNGVQTRAQTARRESDLRHYEQAVLLARINTGKILSQITGNTWSSGPCDASIYGGNPDNTEPKDSPKDNACWVTYYDNLTKIGNAAGMNLDGLKSGDMRGNPYIIDENQGEQCWYDTIYYHTGQGAGTAVGREIPYLDGVNTAC